MKRYGIYKNWVMNDPRAVKINFNVDGRIYYVYRITDIPADEYYYGYRIQVNDDIISDLKAYGSTSKKKQLIIENTNDFKFKIIRTFDNPGDAIIFESFLHQLFNVKNHTKFFNESNQTPFGFDTSGVEPWNKGKSNNQEGLKRSDETKLKMSKSAKNRTITEKVTKGWEKQSKDKTGKAIHSDDMKKVISEATKENWKSNPNMQKCAENFRNNNPAKIKVECPHCKKMIAKTMINRWHNDNCKLKQKD